MKHAGDPDRDRAAERDRGKRDQRAVGEARLQGMPVQLVQGVGGHADREEEGGKRGQQPIGVDRRGRRSAQRDVDRCQAV